MKSKPCVPLLTGIVLSLLLSATGLQAQQRQRIVPLPGSQWKQKKDYDGFMIGSYFQKVSARTELVSFYAFLEDTLNTGGQWNVRHYSPAKAKPLIVIEEKRPVEYLRLESGASQTPAGNWKNQGPWTFRPAAIPAANLAVLIQYEVKPQQPYFVPAIVYRSKAPAQIKSYKAAFIAGTALKGGTYTVKQGKTVLHKGNIGQQLGGASFNISIPVDKLPKKGGIFQVDVSLIESGQSNGPQLVFDFYHQPYKPE